MLELDMAMTLEARVGQVVDVKAGLRSGRSIDSLDALAGAVHHDALAAGVHHVIDVKAGLRSGRSVDSLDALAGIPAGDALVREAATLQLIDVKAHVLGGLA